ncbi:MAG: DUF3800 domain-containing protein [Candidatus Sabulitectum sp.]|nr:DUF3800 domain-containing protein [Candidatus Sabulitectum sp.]
MCETNIYCDESCHLPSDSMRCMVLGALWCSTSSASKFNTEIAAIKAKHNLTRYFEIKWTKVSQSKLNFYIDLLDYFFDNTSLGFRGWVIPDKSILRHDDFNQTHDDWYYKMYFYLIRNIIDTRCTYNIYLDIKDTRSREKLQKLDEVIRNAHYDFSRGIINRIQHVHSHDINLLQLADLLIGALSYHCRQLKGSSAKLVLIRKIKERTGFTLNSNTLPSERKFNLCIWRPKDRNF